jgi:succinoglycan biosynthesis transport protein ExoP
MTRPAGGWRGLESGVAMSSRGEDSVEEPFDYRARLIGDALRRQSLIIVVCVVFGVLLGYGASVARPGSYVATATVLINPLSGNPYSPGVSGQDSLVSIVTESKVAVSDTVSGAAADSLGNVPVSQLEKGVAVSVPPNTQIIEVSFASSDASFARRAAQAYVDSFLAYRITLAKAVSASQVLSLKDQQASVQDQLTTARAKLDSSGGASAYYAQQVKTLTSQVASLQQQVNQLEAQKPDAGDVISPATTPGRTSGIGRPLYLIGGALFGLVAGLALALARQRRDDRVLHVDEIEGAGIPVIAAWAGARGQSAEATRLIRARALAIPKRPTVLVVGPTSALGEPSPVAAALAESLANLPRTVVFVDLADGAAATPDGAAPYGFTDLLTGRRTLLRELLVEKDANLTILPRGRADLSDATEFLDATRMRKVIAELPNRADYVVLNVPSLTDSVGETLMEIANLNVVTVTLARSTRSELALVKSRGDNRVGACLVPRAKRRRRAASSLRFRREGSPHVSRAGDALTLVDDEEESA